MSGSQRENFSKNVPFTVNFVQEAIKESVLTTKAGENRLPLYSLSVSKALLPCLFRKSLLIEVTSIIFAGFPC
ncbi:hypothetical protein BDE36_1856 [Arcticibacter tournemirensis]|nr:hypothetical protein BDE36_1856 [Arcticibacter tournemirensis]